MDICSHRLHKDTGPSKVCIRLIAHLNYTKSQVVWNSYIPIQVVWNSLNLQWVAKLGKNCFAVCCSFQFKGHHFSSPLGLIGGPGESSLWNKSWSKQGEGCQWFWAAVCLQLSISLDTSQTLHSIRVLLSHISSRKTSSSALMLFSHGESITSLCKLSIHSITLTAEKIVPHL